MYITRLLSCFFLPWSPLDWDLDVGPVIDIEDKMRKGPCSCTEACA